MMRELKKQLSMRWDELLLIFVMEAGFFLLGEILLAVAMHISDEDSVFPLGTLMALVVTIFVMIFWGIGGLHLNFSLAVCMSAVRKRFVPCFLAVSLFEDIAAAGIAYLLSFLENGILRTIYPGIKIESGIEVIFHWKYLLPACLAVVALNAFFGTLFLKFGKRALFIFWVLWMLVCIGGPRMSHYAREAQDTAFGRVCRTLFDLFQGFTEIGILAAAVLVSAVLLGISWMMLRRQQANI